MAGPLVKLDLSKYGGSLIVTQGFQSSFTHNGYFSWSLDFALGNGSKVYAFAKGKVISLRESVKDGANASVGDSYLKDPSNGTSNIGNYVTVNSGGVIMTYQHLAYNSVIPIAKADFASGDEIGNVGKTGYRTAPHLHVTFSVAQVDLVAGTVADGRSSTARPVFETATGDILTGVISSGSYSLKGKSLAGDQHNLTLLGTQNADGGGDAYNNIISGNFGNNTLRGYEGTDQLYGGDGKDTLSGGVGRDQLQGGKHADRFVYESADDSRPGASNRDMIIDFSRTEGDKIDLSMVDANSLKSGIQDWVFIGGSSFSGKAGELRYAGGLLQGDVNGDKKIDAKDFEIAVSGDVLKATDFIW